MHSLKRDFIHLSAITALTLACALAWGSPLLSADPAGNQDQQQQPSQTQNQSATFTGTIVKSGDSYVLHDSSGATYQLDDQAQAKQYEGKSVKVTGQLDQQSMTIHVASIESA